jgi:uncharacterized membrane protein
LAFSSGLVSNTITRNTGDFSPNVLIDKRKIQEGNDIIAKKYLYWDRPEVHNVYATEWLVDHCCPIEKVYRDFEDILFTRHRKLWGGKPMMNFIKKGGDVEKGAYIFLARHNYIERVFIRGEEPFLTAEHLSLFEANNKIYDNGGAAIYYTD